MSLNLNLLARETSLCICLFVYLRCPQSVFGFIFISNMFFIFHFAARCFWPFMQPLGVNMLIRGMYNTLSPRRNRNVFEMLIKTIESNRQTFARLDSYLWQLVEI